MKVVLQDGMKDCGVCCLLSIIRYYGGDASKEYLREITNTTKEGVNLYNLIMAAKKIGFDAEGLYGKIDEINVNNLPCIAHLVIKKNYQHFVVLYKINKEKKQVTLMDPSKGKKIISIAEYNLLSSKYYMFLKPIKKLPSLKKNNIIQKKYKELLKNNKQNLFIITILTLNYFVLNIVSSFHFKYILEDSIYINISKNILLISIIMGMIYLCKNISYYLKNILWNKWNSLLTIEITTYTYEHILLLPYLYYKNRTTGEILSRFKDLNIIIDYLTTFLSNITTDVFLIFFFFYLLYQYNKTLLLILNIGLFLRVLLLLILRKYKKKNIKKIKIKEDVMNSYIIQGISNVDTIKGSHLEKRFSDKFKINDKKYQEEIYNHINLLGLDHFINNLLMDIIQVIIYGFGAYLVIQQKLSLSTLILYQTFASYYKNSIENILQIIMAYPEYKISLTRLEELFMLELENFKNNYFYLSYDLAGKIEFHQLNYKIGTKVLFNNLSTTIQKGEKILLCGESGSGKSTLVKMLLRYIEIEYGKIKISGIDINHYHLQNIRNNITYITPNEYLLNDTIKNNITLYQEYPEEEIEKVIRICCVNDIIKDEEQGLNKLIEENGFNLSNGERQRIVLARSIIKKTNIYVFDEALSQIDIYREKKILENIFQYLEDKTIIIISHRFNNKKRFDRILKLENGEIHEN